MKLKHIFTALIAVVATCLTGCSDDDVLQLNNVQVSQSFVTLEKEGGAAEITVNAKGDWQIEEDENAQQWLTVSPLQGGAGETAVTLSAQATASTNSTTLKLTCGGQTQLINVLQQTEKVELPLSTCADVLAGQDGTKFRVKGQCSRITNTLYGNWILKDETGELTVYGTLDAGGNTKNFTSLGMEVGDEVTVEGPRYTHTDGTVELKDVTVISIKKSLAKVESITEPVIAKEGGETTVILSNKGDGMSVEIPEDAQSWLSVKSIATETNISKVTLKATPNEGGKRTATVSLTATSGSISSTVTAEITQDGSIIETTIENFLAAEDGSTQYRITGIVTGVEDAATGKFTLTDHTGNLYVYKGKGLTDNSVKEGDIVTIVGQHGSFRGAPQMANGEIESVKHVEKVTIEEFRNKPSDKDTYYMISGVVGQPTEENTKFDLVDYGNFNLTDATGSVYVYGVTKGWGGKNEKDKGTFASLFVKENDQLTIIAYRTEYKGLVEAVGMYYSHTPANPDVNQ